MINKRLQYTILSNISQSKDNQAMKPVQLMEYNLRNIFVEKSYTKRGGETIPRPFSNKNTLKSHIYFFYCLSS